MSNLLHDIDLEDGEPHAFPIFTVIIGHAGTPTPAPIWTPTQTLS